MNSDAIRQQPPRAPRLGPCPAPFPLESLPFLELPGPAVDLAKEVVSSLAPLGGHDYIPREPPSAPRLRPAMSPMFDEPMPEFLLPEAAMSEGDALHVVSDMELDDWSDNDLDDDIFVLGYLISDASTSVGGDISNCPSPESDSSKSSLSSIQGRQSAKHVATMTALKAVQAFTSEQLEVTPVLTC